MKRISICVLCIALIAVFSVDATAADYIVEADTLFDRGGLENYKQAIGLYLKALNVNPDSYEANWKCARAHREYGDGARKTKLQDWEDICAEYGKKGMQYAARAIEIAPDRPDGHYFYGLSVGVYSDGVSILTALGEGLKDKTQSSFEKTYDIDKMYNNGGPMLSLGRFWAVLPWPMRDRKKSLRYYREYQQTEWFATNTEAQLFLAELLIHMGGKDNKVEAKGFVDKALQSDDPYFRSWADDLNKKLK
jgi:tetratricopeptide (TPR) repeat protein